MATPDCLHPMHSSRTPLGFQLWNGSTLWNWVTALHTLPVVDTLQQVHIFMTWEKNSQPNVVFSVSKGESSEAGHMVGGTSITFVTIYFFIKHGGKGLAPQAWGPEFGSPEPTWKLGKCDVIPALRWWRQGKPMSKQASNYSISKCWVGLRDPASVNKKRVITDVNLMSLHALTHTHTHANTYILTIHICTYTYQRRTCIESIRIPWSWKPRTQQVHSVPLQVSVCLNWFEQRQYSQVK